MQIDISETYDIGRELNPLVTTIEHSASSIAAALARPAPRASAPLESACHAITGETRRFAARYPAITAIQTRVQARALAQGATIGATRVQMPQHWYDLNTDVNRLRQVLNLWPGVQALVLEQVRPPRRALYPRTPGPGNPGAAARAACDQLGATLHRLLNPAHQDAAARDHGCHDDIPLPDSWFMEHALAARRICLAARLRAEGGAARALKDVSGTRMPLRFLDVGCGGGLKVISALQMFDRASGLEYDAGFADAARSLVARAGVGDVADIVTGDGMTFDGYGDFDVIYAFRPMHDADGLERLERQIVQGARRGTLIVAPYRGFAARHEDLGCALVAGSVFAVGIDTRAATRLRRAAEVIGVALEQHKRALPTLWDPILDASFANGFALPMTDWRQEI